MKKFMTFRAKRNEIIRRVVGVISICMMYMIGFLRAAPTLKVLFTQGLEISGSRVRKFFRPGRRLLVRSIAAHSTKPSIMRGFNGKFFVTPFTGGRDPLCQSFRYVFASAFHRTKLRSIAFSCRGNTCIRCCALSAYSLNSVLLSLSGTRNRAKLFLLRSLEEFATCLTIPMHKTKVSS